jgi:hypothetical protein
VDADTHANDYANTVAFVDAVADKDADPST